MRRLAAALAFAGLAVSPGPAAAWTAADLREACTDGDLYYLYGACTGYLIAVADALPPGTVCLPQDGTAFAITDATDAVVALPETAGEMAGELAARALEQTHGCEGSD
jgi:hypothetical protein